MPSLRLFQSFYWKIAASFVALVIVVLIAQSAVVSYFIAQPGGPLAPGNPNATAALIAAAMGESLALNEHQDVASLLQRAAARSPQTAFVVMRDGVTAATAARTLSPENLRQAEAVLAGRTPVTLPTDEPTGPVVSAPIHAHGRLLGLVILPPPEREPLLELRRVLSLPGTIVIVAAATGAALLIFAPARRRLRTLEVAVERLGAGDLAARVPEMGHDELARLAGSFNRMASELSARTEALRASDESRRQMVADVSHELKTPLTVLIGYLDTLAMPDVSLDSDVRTRYLATARRETKRLQRIVADLLELAKHENHVGELDVRLFDVDRLFAHVIDRHRAGADAAHVQLRGSVADGADQLVADPDRLEQVLDNLVANALRYTPADGVVELRASATAMGHRLVVMDTGRGIPSEHLDHIFDRFYKVDSARTSGIAGSGLGLAIVQAIVRRHGGTVSATSVPGRTEFVIELPQRPTAPIGGPSSASRQDYVSTSANL